MVEIDTIWFGGLAKGEPNIRTTVLTNICFNPNFWIWFRRAHAMNGHFYQLYN